MSSPFRSRGECRAAHRLFGSAATAPRRARAFVRSELARWDLSRVADTAELLVSELVTNAVNATETAPNPPIASSIFPVALRTVGLRLGVSPGPRSLLIEVWDGSERMPVVAERGELAEGGRGLALVEGLASRWGHYTAPDRGKIVWCELPIPRPSAGAPCPAAGDSVAAVVESPQSPGPVAAEPAEALVASGHLVSADLMPGEVAEALPHRVRDHPRAAPATGGPDTATLLRVLEGLRRL
ncbi:ATP-binding protein [Microbispora sp. RL4-1S]|uniref:ATP-binding protein n=1 Tax=Microbispora oryzae TaxID=2806554 RepID=A0A941AII2_9ACTN|nr:ATP-binding protein [Microbispora oryzae]MBP2703887.1 ATP-binding protein [Microbispora oryzae]